MVNVFSGVLAIMAWYSYVEDHNADKKWSRVQHVLNNEDKEHRAFEPNGKYKHEARKIQYYVGQSNLTCIKFNQ